MSENDMAKIARLVADPHADARAEVQGLLVEHERLTLELIATRARVAKLEGVLKECADDLEAEFLHKYSLNDETIHPAQQRDFDRDMDLVVRARAALSETVEA
jgi:hypothetical protein